MAFVTLVLPLPAISQAANPQELTLDRLAVATDWRAASPTLTWSGDGDSSLEQEASSTIEGAKDLVRYDNATRKRSVVVKAEDLIPAGSQDPLEVDAVHFSDDGKRLLLFTNSKKVWRLKTRGDYWIFDFASRKLTQLATQLPPDGRRAEPSSLFFAKLSPNGKQVAYVWQNDLYVETIDSRATVRLTTDGSDLVINGMGDWANEEELRIRDGFRWSPDGKKIAFWRFDTSDVGRFVLTNQSDLYPTLQTFPYPKAGTTNSSVSIGVVDSVGGPVTWMRDDDDPRNHYISQLEWAGNSHEIMVQHLNRHQNVLMVMLGDVVAGTYRRLLIERDSAWVDDVSDWRWLDDGTRLLWVSERDGWRHVYAVSRDGETTTLLTPGQFDVVSIEGFDSEAGVLYFVADPDGPLERYLFRAPLDGSGTVERVTPAESPGFHRYKIAPNGRWAIHSVSTFDDPGSTELIRLPGHTTERSLADNAELRERVQALDRGDFRFFRLPVSPEEGGGEASVDGYEIRPPNFDPSKKYPVLFHVYGEPASQTVANRWGGTTYLWHLMLAQQGYLVMSIDNRGTAAPRGRDLRKIIYKRLGALSSADQAEAARQIASWDYVDGERFGIYGHSGGGSMTLNMLFREPGLYKVGMSLAPVPDQRYYDTIYQERYLGLPFEDPEVYEQNSPISFADQLEDSLLIIHGTGDDNCHYQGTEALIDRLVEHNKLFTVMPYPNRTHGLREGTGTTEHIRHLMTDFLHRNLPAGPR
ncbi:MAG: DPP IV N-terminal domain-containing protein [Thermoanaerobaculia bacterium]|nr:DPP IV N-terminal domain-containing protein [Thermoanaerobaculia bacterium]